MSNWNEIWHDLLEWVGMLFFNNNICNHSILPGIFARWIDLLSSRVNKKNSGILPYTNGLEDIFMQLSLRMISYGHVKLL